MNRRLVAVLLALPLAARADFADHHASKSDVGAAKAPVRGRIKVLVIPAQVPNRTALDVATLRRFFEGDAPGEVGFKSYWRTMSGGKLELDVTMMDVVQFTTCPLVGYETTCSLPRGDLGTLDVGIGALRETVRRANDMGIDFAQFDVNGPLGGADGIVDGMVLVTNMGGAGIGVPIFSINTGDNLAGGRGGAFVVDGVEVRYVAVATDRGNGRPQEIALHEFGHILGLTDLYDESSQSAGLQFTQMGNGYNYGTQFTALDAETRRALGWAEVRVVSGMETITLQPVGRGNAVVKLGMGLEYFVAEARGANGGIDADITQPGLALYHVDWRRGPTPEPGGYVFRLLECVECKPWHPYIMNEQADGLFGLQLDGPRDNAGDLFRGGDVFAADANTSAFESNTDARGVPGRLVLSSNFYDGRPSGVEVKDVQVHADGSVTATFTAPAVADPCADVACWPGLECRAGNCLVPEAPPPETDPEGCGCAGANGGAWLWLASASYFFLKRSSRRRRASACGSSSAGGAAGLPEKSASSRARAATDSSASSCGPRVRA